MDNENVYRSSRTVRYDILLELAARNGGVIHTAYTYIIVDSERLETDRVYRAKKFSFFNVLRSMGVQVVEVPIQRWPDGNGGYRSKADCDVFLAVDAMKAAEKLDRVILVSGDGDFVPLVKALQNKGCRVEVVGFNSVNQELRRTANQYISGYMIPGLVPISDIEECSPTWGEIGSRVRGFCNQYDPEKGYGTLRFLRGIEGGIWREAQGNNNAYATAFFHDTSFNREDIDRLKAILPSYYHYFEFDLIPGREHEFIAKNIACLLTT